MLVSILHLKELLEVKIICISCQNDSKTDISVNMYGNPKNLNHLHVQVVVAALKHVLQKSIKMNYSENLLVNR